MARSRSGLIAALSSLLVGSSLGGLACDTPLELAHICTPNVREVCYDGPVETLGVGKCRAGIRACKEDGQGFGACEGAVMPAPEVCGGGGDENCDGKTDECTGDLLWAKRWYGHGYAQSISADGLGNVVLGVSYKQSVDLGKPAGIIGATNVNGASAVVKIDAGGEIEFTRVVDVGEWMSFISADTAGNIAGILNFQVPITLNGEMFTPSDFQDSLVYSLNPAGDFRFRHQFDGDGSCGLTALDTDPRGEVIASGDCFIGSINIGDEASVAGTFIVRFSESGDFVYAKQFPKVRSTEVKFDGQGNIVMTGSFFAFTDFGGPKLEGSDGQSWFLVKLGPTGEHIWSKQFTGVDDFPMYLEVEPDHAGNVFVLAGFHSTVDFGAEKVTSLAPDSGNDIYLFKLDAEGNHVWGKHFGNGSAQNAYDLSVDASGNVILLAGFRGSIDFGAGSLYAAAPNVSDFAVVKFTSEGKAVWSRRFGAGSTIYALVIATGPLGDIFLAGNVVGDIDFGTGVLPAKNYAQDMFVVKLSP